MLFSVLQPFDLNEVDIMVSFPERYPQEVCMFEMFQNFDVKTYAMFLLMKANVS